MHEVQGAHHEVRGAGREDECDPQCYYECVSAWQQCTGHENEYLTCSSYVFADNLMMGASDLGGASMTRTRSGTYNFNTS